MTGRSEVAGTNVVQQELLNALVSSKRVSKESAERAAELLRQMGIPAVAGLLRLNAIAELPLYRFYADWLQLPLVEVAGEDVPSLIQSVRETEQRLEISSGWATLKGFLVFERAGQIWLAVRDVVDEQVNAVVRRKAAALGTAMSLAVITPALYDELRPRRLDRDGASTGDDDLKTLRELAEEGPTIELVNGILSQAVTQRASDVHIEPGEFNFAVRLRVDGEMLSQSIQPRDRFDAVACRIKILSNLDIAERRLPQDGRINARVNGESFDIRVSVLPGSTGESIVLRLLRQERRPTQLRDLGMNQKQAEAFSHWSQYPHGIVLVTGPTGSGKSTTLYTALELANDRTKKIITVEDPVEYKIPASPSCR